MKETFLTKTEKIIQLIIIAIMAVLLMIALSTESQAQGRTLRVVKKDQAYYSFERWKKDYPKNRINQLKYAIQASNENSKESRKNERVNKKIEGIRQKIK